MQHAGWQSGRCISFEWSGRVFWLQWQGQIKKNICSNWCCVCAFDGLAELMVALLTPVLGLQVKVGGQKAVRIRPWRVGYTEVVGLFCRFCRITAKTGCLCVVLLEISENKSYGVLTCFIPSQPGGLVLALGGAAP